MYGVYVHVPWCRTRCPYCAFAVDTRLVPEDAGWRTRVLADWDRERPHFKGRPETLHFGGGTPSRAELASLAAVIRAVDPRGEVSLEANPDDVTEHALRAWKDMGVSRLSLGVQTFQPSVASRLGRAHSARVAVNALELARAVGFGSVSTDILYGHPAQTVDLLLADIAHVVDVGVEHVSVYSLTIEPGTRFGDAHQPLVDEDTWLLMHDRAAATLEAAGFERYEVSNFARSGFRSVHNEHYWRARPWAGLGPSAHGWRPDGLRVANVSDVDGWLGGEAPTEERVTGRARLWELIWSTLRHMDGVDRERILALTGVHVTAPHEALDAGLLLDDGQSIRLGKGGFCLADALTEAVVAASVRNWA